MDKATHLERENLKLLADNAALLEIIRNLRLDIETYKSTLEGLQRRVVRFDSFANGRCDLNHIGNAIGEIV